MLKVIESDELSRTTPGVHMTSGCNFERLIQLLDKRLSLDHRLELLDHLDRCDNCRDAIYQLSRDRDKDFFIYPPRKSGKTAVA